MKLLVIGDKARFEKFLPDLPIAEQVEAVVAERSWAPEAIVASAPDADFILADAISPVTADMIDALPNLKLIHSEGVAFNAIDIARAKEKGIFVCNNRGANAVAVAEQTILLMLGLLKNVCAADRAVREGKQIQIKEHMMVAGIGELAGAKVGLLGFGDIAKQVAVRCSAFGAEVFYNKRSPLSAEEEAKWGNAKYMELDELVSTCDFISIHVPVSPSTKEMVNDDFFAKMKDGSYLVNTARGEIVDNAACLAALKSGKLAGAGFDTIAPEPVQADNILVDLPEELRDKVLYSPHVGGVTTNTFRRVHRHVWQNIERVAKGERPDDIVNGL